MDFDLKESEALWKRRHTYRNLRVKLWARRETYRYDQWLQYRNSKPDGDPLRAKWRALYEQADRKLDEWIGKREEASYWLRRRRQQIRDTEPKSGSASAHFNISEFNTHDGTPVPKVAYDGVRDLCERVLEPMRAEFGACYVLSGHRHKTYNAGIGGATRSFHIYDFVGRQGREVAADLRFARGTPAQWAAYARRLGVGGVGQYDRSGFVHVDNGPSRTWSG